MTVLSQREFYNFMKDYFIANQNKVTDLNSGSAMDTQFNAMAIQLNQALVKVSGGFKEQFEQIPFQTFNFQRKEELYSSGTAVFSRQTSTPDAVTIPVGTVIGTPAGLLFTTEEVGTILAGNLDSNAVNIKANKPGAKYDILVDGITVINSSVPGINSVTNNTATAGGCDKETNSEYFARFTNFMLGLDGSSRYGVWTAAVTVDTILSGYVQDHFPPESGLYNFTIYVDDGSGSVPAAKLDEIYLKIYGNDTAEYQGYAAAGINFRVLTAGLIPVNVVYTVEIDPLADVDAVVFAIENAIKNYINSLWVGSDVLGSEVVRIIKGISSVIDVPPSSLTLNGGENITATASQVPRVSTITETVT